MFSFLKFVFGGSRRKAPPVPSRSVLEISRMRYERNAVLVTAFEQKVKTWERGVPNVEPDARETYGAYLNALKERLRIRQRYLFDANYELSQYERAATDEQWNKLVVAFTDLELSLLDEDRDDQPNLPE